MKPSMKTSIRSSLILSAVLLSAPALAQGQGGYSPGVPGKETAAMPSDVRARARAEHQTNDTAGGTSSIDKSGKTAEGGRTIDGRQPGEIGRGAAGEDRGLAQGDRR